MIRNADELGGTDARATALACVEAGIEAAAPERVIEASVSLDADGDGDGDGDCLRVADLSYDLAAYDRAVMVGGGKAAGGVARALERLLGDRLDGGAVVVPDPVDPPLDRVEATVGGHPTPDEGSVAGAERVLDLVRSADERTLMVVAVTGGGSALLAAPAEGVSLADLRVTTDALLDSGAAIDEINAVRKHLSAIKGGRLARAAAPATVVGLAFSDVVGDDTGVIASGPTAPDDSAFADALAALDRYGVDASAAVRDRLDRGAAGDLPETPAAGDAAFDRADTRMLADGFTAVAAAHDAAADRGYDTCILSSRVRGEAREAAKTHVAVAEEAAATGEPLAPPAVVLAGGETTVTVRGDGEGGPNTEFALAAGIELAAGPGDPLADREAAVAAVDTDGRDGATDAAGAVVDADTVDDPAAARDALADNDALSYLDARGAAIRTGPTGTNVNDLRAAVIEDAT